MASRARAPIQLAPELGLPLDAVTETFGIFGQKGSGKSSTAAVFVEQGVAAGGRFVIADPTGVWWGLMHDGDGPGLPGIVFGGEHADVPLERTGGHVVAEFVVQQDEYQVVVLDMKLMRKADRTTFMLAFLETLYHDNREALHVVLDESWQFAPTQAREGGEQIKLLGAVEDVVALGRSRGLGITMISQRFATLNANVREQIGNLVAHRLVGSLDRKALKGWIEAQADPAREKDVMEVMAKLKTAEALVWSPAFLDYFGVVKMDAPQTFDSRATPKVGQRVKKPGKRAQVDLAVLRERMAATIQEAYQRDPKILAKRLADSEKIARGQAAEIDQMQDEIDSLHKQLAERPPETVTVEVPVLKPEDWTKLDRFCQSVQQGQENVTAAYESLRETLYPLAYNVKDAAQRVSLHEIRPTVPPRGSSPSQRQARVLAGMSGAGPDATEAGNSAGNGHVRGAEPASAHRPARSGPVAVPGRDASGGANTSLTGPEQRVLDAIAWYGILGNSTPTKQQVGFIAGYRVGKSVGGTYGNILGKLRSRGLLSYPSPGTVALTGEGVAVARDPGIEPTNEAVQDAVIARLNGPEARVLRVLIDAYPEAMRKQEVGAASGYNVGPSVGGTFGNILGRLRSLGVIEYPSPGDAVATEVLFPLGLRA